MALTIQTNVFSLNAQRNLRRVENPLQTSLQRLSSGFRINSARDDAAGFAITTRQTTQIKGLSQAIRNSNDGVSFAQTAEGAMDEMITALQRVNELSVQSASNNTATDRSSINEEVSQLVAELNRIVSQTRFNGETFLNKQKSINVQVGTNVNELINVSSQNVSPTTLGVSTTYSATLGASDVAGAALQVYLSSGLTGAATLDGKSLGDAIVASDTINNSSVIIDRLNDKSGDTGVTAFSFGNALVSSAALTTAATDAVNVDSGYITVNGITIGSFSLTSQASVAITNLASAINAKSNSTGVTANVVLSSTGASERLVLSNTTGAGISVSVDTNVSNASLVTANPFASGSQSVDANQNGKIVLNAGISKTSLAVDGAQSTRAIIGATPSDGTSVSLTKNTVNDLNVSTAGGANVAILAVQTALDTISAQKAKLGATQNRLATTVSNLDNVRENANAARSRIRDADFAEESANLTKNLLIQQAGISILGQANGLTQNVLALLQ
jgi:flagellin